MNKKEAIQAYVNWAFEQNKEDIAAMTVDMWLYGRTYSIENKKGVHHIPIQFVNEDAVRRTIYV